MSGSIIWVSASPMDPVTAMALFPATNRHTGANTLLAYFHYCNKAVYPFSTECKDQDLQSLAQLDDEAISFVHYARQFVAEHSE